ncbi:MAG: tetratricopeptide repeat protein [Deltaproteobacteria bacterium]|nr:tetratricopeptide repeat protein [Deltaproteobacteria bacterium]
MHTKILLVAIIFILIGFFYLHTENPAVVTYVVTPGNGYTVPVTMLVFAGFLGGVAVAVLNSLLSDAKRAIKEMRERREKKALTLADESYRRGVEALNRGNTAEARELIERGLKARPNDAGMTLGLAETFIRENRGKEALKILEAALAANPDSIGLLNAVANCAAEAGETRRAAKALEGVVERDPKNLNALRKLRDLRVKESLWSDAAELQKNIADCAKDDAAKRREKRFLTGLLFESAVGHLEDGRLADAIGKVKEVLKNDAGFMPAHMLLGEAVYRQGNTGGAIKVWEKAYGRYPASEPLLLKLEDAYIRASEPDRILDKYKRELAAHPGNANLRLLLARLYLRLEMVDAAIEELERICQETEEPYYPQILLGEAYLRRKQSGKAAQLFQRALAVDGEFSPPFECSECKKDARSWAPRCPSCGEWNTFAMTGVHRHGATGRERKE